MSGCLVWVFVLAIPNWFPVVAARTVLFQLVSESGYFTLMVALPFLSVMRSGFQRMVERKSVRTCTAGSGAASRFSSIAAPKRENCRPAAPPLAIGASARKEAAG